MQSRITNPALSVPGAMDALNTWNRINVMARQVSGEWTAQWVS